MATDKKTMTLNLSDAEMAALEELSAKKELTKTALIRQALRLYQLVESKLAKGEKMIFEDEASGKKSEMVML